MRAILLCLALAASLSAADLVGRWKGHAEVKEPSGEVQRMPVVFVFTNENGELRGTAEADNEHRVALTELRLENDRLTFVAKNHEVTMRFEGTVKGERIEGKGTGTTDDGSFSASFSLTRSE